MEHINLELVPRGIERTAHASQYDHGRQIRFDIYNGGTPYTLSGAETITMQVNGQSEAVPNTSDDYIIWTVPDELCETDGVTECELRIVESGVLIGSKNFFLEVEYDPYGTGVLILSVHGSPANFNTDLSDNAVECKVDIGYNANGYKSALVVNTSNAPSEDSTPYLFRPSYSNGYGYETLIGGTCGVNQLVQNGNFADTSVWVSTNASLTVASNIGTVALSGNWGRISQNLNGDRRLNGKYLITCAIKANSSSDIGKKVRIGLAKSDTSDFDYRSYDLTDSWITVNYLINSSYATANYLTITGNNNICTFDLKNVNVIDLTQMFGSTIADYAYTLESGTAGAGIAWLKANGFFGADYYPYNSGALLSVKTSKKINVGFNAWDEVWENGQYDSSGLPSPNNNVIRSKNYIPVISGETYYFKSDGQWIYVCQYDSNKNFIGSREGFGGGLKTLLPNCCYIHFNLSGSYGNTYLNNICINLHSDLDGQYKPYVSHEYDLSGNRKVHRVFGIVNLGDIDCTRLTDGAIPYFRYIFADSTMTQLVNNFICSHYAKVPFADIYTSGTDKACASYAGGVFIISDTAYSTASDFKTAMATANVKLVYELATPFDETVSNPELRGILKLDSDNNLYYYGDTCSDFTNPQLVDGNGTEQFVDGRTVEMPVGHETIYGEDMKARFTDFGVTVYGGEFNLTTGVLTSTKNADGTDKNPPDVYQLTPASMPVRNGENYVLGNTNGDAYVKYYKKA